MHGIKHDATQHLLKYSKSREKEDEKNQDDKEEYGKQGFGK